MANFIQNLFNGVTIGMVYFLIAAGMSIVLGIMGITNLAHGAIFMIGAYSGLDHRRPVRTSTTTWP